MKNPHHITDDQRLIILTLAAQPDIHSISCPFTDFDLWKGLIHEQLRRSHATGKPPQEALCLVGPDCGIRGLTNVRVGWLDFDEHPPEPDPDTGNYVPDMWGGDIFIPYENTTSADLFILPEWHNVFPEYIAKPNARFHRILGGRVCNYLLTDRDLGVFDSATRTLIDDWFLYRCNGPHLDCNHNHLDDEAEKRLAARG